MPLFAQESLETLRSRLDLVEVLIPYVELKRAGAVYKALCPFHEEKTPSFTVDPSDHHYHCFGCGAHGDAIQFLIEHQKMGFTDAVELLAERFHVPLVRLEETHIPKGPSKTALKEALIHAGEFFHFYLLNTPEGHQALQYLQARGLSLDFVRQFQLGLCPKEGKVFFEWAFEKGGSKEILVAAGLAKERPFVPFFEERILFPIHDGSGTIIGFSGRKWREETFGGKYINTPETPLFKKSRVLFGLSYSRRRIAKERRVIIVEGQIDALRLIEAGLDLTVAGQGTAFGREHAAELVKLGIQTAYLAFDGDLAGREAALKIGDLFQSQGVDVQVIHLPEGSDPDQHLNAFGVEGVLERLEASESFLPFLYREKGKQFPIQTPAGKNNLVQELSKQIRQWKGEVLVHESLRSLASLAAVPLEMIGQADYRPTLIQKRASAGLSTIDPDQIVESDVLMWLVRVEERREELLNLAKKNINESHFQLPGYRALWNLLLTHEGPLDLFTLGAQIEESVIEAVLAKRINRDRALEGLTDALQRLLDRNWLLEREKLRMQIQSGQIPEEELMLLLKRFEALKRVRPEVKR